MLMLVYQRYDEYVPIINNFFLNSVQLFCFSQVFWATTIPTLAYSSSSEYQPSLEGTQLSKSSQFLAIIYA